MKKLWDCAMQKHWSNVAKVYWFLFTNTILWIAIPLILCLIAGTVTGYNTQWMEWTTILTGYSGMGLGFFGGVIFYMRQSY